MALYPTIWTEAKLYESGYDFSHTYHCDTCGEVVSVYQNRKQNKKLFLIDTMEVHPNHAAEE